MRKGKEEGRVSCQQGNSGFSCMTTPGLVLWAKPLTLLCSLASRASYAEQIGSKPGTVSQ